MRGALVPPTDVRRIFPAGAALTMRDDNSKSAGVIIDDCADSHQASLLLI
jgi:hypothetical protein